MVAPLQNVVQIAMTLSRAVNMPPLPSMASQHTASSVKIAFAKRGSNMLFLVCKTLHNMKFFLQ